MLCCVAVVRSAAFKPIVDVVTAHSQPLLEEAAAIGVLASKLQPMVQRSQQLQQEREHPIAAALAAAASAAAGAPSAGGSRRRTGGKGASTAGEAAAAAAAERDVCDGDVEQQVRQMMAEAGASLQQLRQFNATLGAAGNQ